MMMMMIMIMLMSAGPPSLHPSISPTPPSPHTPISLSPPLLLPPGPSAFLSNFCTSLQLL